MNFHDITKPLYPAPIPKENPWVNASQKLSSSRVCAAAKVEQTGKQLQRVDNEKENDGMAKKTGTDKRGSNNEKSKAQLQKAVNTNDKKPLVSNIYRGQDGVMTLEKNNSYDTDSFGSKTPYHGKNTMQGSYIRSSFDDGGSTNYTGFEPPFAPAEIFDNSQIKLFGYAKKAPPNPQGISRNQIFPLVHNQLMESYRRNMNMDPPLCQIGNEPISYPETKPPPIDGPIPIPFFIPIPMSPPLIFLNDTNTRDKTFEQLKKQIGFYFSVDNLCKDLYLRKQLDKEGFINIEVIENFSRVKIISDGNRELIKKAIEGIEEIELVHFKAEHDSDVIKIRVRSGWEKWVLK